MKKEKILGICKFGSNIVELVGEAQLIRSIFLSSVLFTNFGSTNYRLVSLAGTGWGKSSSSKVMLQSIYVKTH
jgi:hypothetical protein